MARFPIKGSAAIACSLLFGLTGVATGVSAIWYSHRERAFAADVQAFVAVPAVVQSVDVKTGSRSGSARPDVRYEYVVDGRRYESDRFSASWINLGAPPQVEAYLAEHGYTQGAVVDAYLDPKDPTRVVLNKSVQGNFRTMMWVLTGAGCLFGLVGAGMVAGTALSSSHRARLRTGR